MQISHLQPDLTIINEFINQLRSTDSADLFEDYTSIFDLHNFQFYPSFKEEFNKLMERKQITDYKFVLDVILTIAKRHPKYIENYVNGIFPLFAFTSKFLVVNDKIKDLLSLYSMACNHNPNIYQFFLDCFDTHSKSDTSPSGSFFKQLNINKAALALLDDDLETFTRLVEDKTVPYLQDSFLFSNKSPIKSFFPDEDTSSLSYIGFCCLLGSKRCFMFLATNDVPLTNDLYPLAIYGGDDEIIHTLYTYFEPIYSDVRDCIINSILTHRFPLIQDFIRNFHYAPNDLSYFVNLSIKNYNLQTFLYFISTRQFYSLTEELRNDIFYSVFSYDFLSLTKFILLQKPGFIKQPNSRGQMPLHIAIKSNLLTTVEFLITQGAYIEDYDCNGNTPLLLAVKQISPEIVRSLILDGCHKFARNYLDQTAVHIAVLTYGFQILQDLISNGFDKEAKDSKGNTALHLSIINYNEQMVKYLIGDANCDKEAQNNEGQTPFHLAVKYNNKEIIGYLHSEGCDINAKDKHMRTPLHYAVMNDNLSMVQVLLSYNDCNIEARDKIGRTPFHYAAERGSIPILQYLVLIGADPNAPDLKGNTPMHIACMYNKLEVVLFLYDGYSDIQVENKKRKLPLHYACKAGALLIMQYLIKYGADKEARDASKNTPLHYAVKSGSTEVLDYLISLGCNREAKTYDGRTPLHLAAKFDNLKLVKYLISKGCDYEARDRAQRTPLLIATLFNGRRTVDYLLSFCNKDVQDIQGNTAFHIAAVLGNVPMIHILYSQKCNPRILNNDKKPPYQLAFNFNFNEAYMLLLNYYQTRHHSRRHSDTQ